MTDKQSSDLLDGEGTGGWRPSEGETLEGPIVRITRAWSDWTNSYYPLLTVRDKARNADVDLHCFHATLQDSVMETRPKVNDRIKVSYLGKRNTKDGKRQVAIYQVEFPDATGQEVWDALGSQKNAHAKAASAGTPPDEF